MKLLDHMPIRVTLDDVLKRLRMPRERSEIGRVGELIDAAQGLINLRAIYDVSYIDHKNEDVVQIGGVRFRSRVLRVNLDRVERVFPYIITIGKALEEKAASLDDIMEQYCLEVIGDVSLGAGRVYLEEHLQETYRPGQLSRMSPGSLEDWPITEQRQLFSLLPDAGGAIQVTLTESLLMVPRKSISGIYFPTEVDFHSCQLCPRANCVGRKAPYDPELEKRYARSG